MSIVYALHNAENPYRPISTSVFSYGLSAKASGVLCFLLSCAEHWEPNVKHLASIFKEGQYAIQRALDELKEKGFIVKTAIRDNMGQIIDWKTIVYEQPLTPEELPCDRNHTIDINGNYHRHVKEQPTKDLQQSDPDLKEPDLGNYRQTNIDTTTKNETKKEPPLPPKEEEVEQEEEVIPNSTTPSQINQESSSKPKPQKLDNLFGNSPKRENLPKPLFSDQSLQQTRRSRANQSMDFPEKLGLEKKELERFELELYQWAIIHKPGVPPDWLVRDSTRAVALEDRVNVWLLHFKAYGTLKNFLEKPPGEWEEVYEENGWAKVRTNQSFYQWLYEAQIHDRQGVTPQQATEKVHWQLRDRKLASSLWQSYKNYLSNRDREYEEQRKLGASGLGAVPSCLKPKKEISLEQTMEIENKLSGMVSPTHQIEGIGESAPQLSPSNQEEEFTEEERRANLKRLNQMMGEAFRKKDLLLKAKGWEPNYSLEQMNSMLKSGVHSVKEQVVKFVEASGDYELIYDDRGFAIAVKEVDF